MTEKKNKTIIGVCVGLLAGLFLIGPGVMLEARQTATPTINAINQRVSDEKYVLSDSVEIAWEEYRIYADYAEYNFKTKKIIAKGRVTMTSGETVLSGEKLTFDLEARTGVMYDTYGQMAPTLRYKTDKLEQVDNDTLKFKKLEFTSCAQCVPRWKITCSKGKIKKEKYIEMTHAVVKVKNIPVLYIPYMRYPVTSDGKASGFLFPKIGSSDLRGFFFLNSFFWNIKPNLDLTLSFDYYGDAGLGAASELRYMFPNVEGQAYFYYFRYKSGSKLYEAVIDRLENQDTDPSEIELPKGEYLLKMSHRQKIPLLNSNLIVSIDKQSDANFLRLFSNDFFSVLRRTSRSSIALTSKILENLKLSAKMSWMDTYYTFNNSQRSLNYLPTIDLNLNQQKIWKVPGYFSLNARFSSVQRLGKSYDEEGDLFETDTSTQRLSFEPSYSLSLVKEAWISAQATVSSRHSIYFKSKDPETKEVVNKKLHLYYHIGELQFTGPTLYKIFNIGKSKFKHIFMPRVDMRYVTKVPEEDRQRLIPLDGFDYPLYSYVSFKLTNKLLFKGRNDRSAREILSYIISQDYYFDPALAHRGRNVGGLVPVWGELKNTLRIKPTKQLSLNASLNFSHFMDGERLLDQFPRINLRLSYTDKSSPIQGNFNYSSYINKYAPKTFIFNRETIGGMIKVDFPKFPIKLQANVNYDLTEKLFRHGTIKLIYDYQCIRFNGELRIFNYSGREEFMFNFGISFGNMGLVKDLMGVED